MTGEGQRSFRATYFRRHADVLCAAVRPDASLEWLGLVEREATEPGVVDPELARSIRASLIKALEQLGRFHEAHAA